MAGQYKVTKGLRLYRWFDKLIVASTKRDAQSMLTETGLTLTNFRRFPLTEVKGEVEMQERPEGEPINVMRPAQEVIELCGRGIIPEGE